LNLLLGTITWKVNNCVVHKVSDDILKDGKNKWIPFVQLEEGCKVSIYVD
jgi:hypothetical protein